MRIDNCSNCGKPPYYFSKYDRFACLACDIWTEKDHCPVMECDLFLHSCDILPSEAEKSGGDFQR